MKKKKIAEYILLGASILVLLVVAITGIGKTKWEEELTAIRNEESLWQKFESFINDKFDKLQGIKEKRASNLDQRNMMELFSLVYVACDEEEQKEGNFVKIAATEETQLKIDAFNEYMLNGNGKEYAERIGYSDLPEGKLTIAYIMENQEEMADIIAWWHEAWDGWYAQDEIDSIYYELRKSGGE